MRKVNKILMATVSILLCLVLITTSVLSGIFAKYVITKKGSAAATLKKFGVTLDMDVDDEALEDAGADVETAVDYYEVTKSVTITGLKMAPGVNLDEIITISLSGTPTVNCRFKLDIDFDFDTEKFIIPYGKYGVTNSNGELHFPVRLSCGAPNEDNIYQIKSSLATSKEQTGGAHEKELYDDLIFSVYFKSIGGRHDEVNDKYIDLHMYRDFDLGKQIFLHPATLIADPINETFYSSPIESVSFNEFKLGFNWPFADDDPSDVDNMDARDTYIMNQNPEGLDFTYKVTVSVEQIIPE